MEWAGAAVTKRGHKRGRGRDFFTHDYDVTNGVSSSVLYGKAVICFKGAFVRKIHNEQGG